MEVEVLKEIAGCVVLVGCLYVITAMMFSF